MGKVGTEVGPAVQELNRTAEYFRDVLGFRLHWEDASDWRLVERDSVRIMLGSCANDIRASDLGSHSLFGYVGVNDVDELYAELSGRGAESTKPTNRPYGMREIVVTTPEGHRIIFGQDVP
jgi:uncharacterized glyoxalase superfamily protein PhnB